MERLVWVLIVHQNLSGNTALHTAAREGNMKGVKAIYRLFHYMDMDDNDPESEFPENWEY